MGALSCSADKADNKGASNIPNTVPTDKTDNKGASNIPNTVPTDKTDNKGASNIPNTVPTDKTANISTVPGKKGLSNLAVAGIIAGSVAIVGAFVLIVEKVLLNGDNSEN
jgi:hypothetical protein